MVIARSFSIDEYHRMQDRGVLRRGARTELLAGTLVDLPAPGPQHGATVRRLHTAWARISLEGKSLRLNDPLTLSNDTEVEPDLAVVPREVEQAAVRHPTTALLVVDVVDERLEDTRALKVPAYASANVTEVWLVNLPDRRVECFLRPDPVTSTYRDALLVDAKGWISSTVLPMLSLEASVVFS